MEHSRSKQFLSFKLWTILSSMVKSQAAPLHPAWGNEGFLFVEYSHVYVPCPLVTEEPSQLSDQKSIAHTVFSTIRGFRYSLRVLEHPP